MVQKRETKAINKLCVREILSLSFVCGAYFFEFCSRNLVCFVIAYNFNGKYAPEAGKTRMRTAFFMHAGCSCCFFIQIQGWICSKLQDCFTRYPSPQVVEKCEQIVCMTSCEFDEQASKPKFVAQSRLTLYYQQLRVQVDCPK